MTLDAENVFEPAVRIDGRHLAITEIVERGSHDELLARDGRYAQMWRLQQAEEPATDERETMPVK